jgi:hypothetical protein
MITKTWWETTKREPTMMQNRFALLVEGRWEISQWEQEGDEPKQRKYHETPFATKRQAKRAIKKEQKRQAIYAAYKIVSRATVEEVLDELRGNVGDVRQN